MFFRKHIIEYKDNDPEGEENELLFLAEKIDYEIELAIKNALLIFDRQQSLTNRTLSYIFSEPAVITFLRKHARYKRTSLNDFCEFLSALGKIQSTDNLISKTIQILKKNIEHTIQWDIFKYITIFEKFMQNNSFSLIQLIKNQEHINEMDEALSIIKKDVADATLHKQTHGDDFFIEHYWESDIHWQKMFNDVRCAGLINQSISLLSKLPGMTTAEYCHKIYNSHHLVNLVLLTEFEKNLNNIYLAYTKKKEVLSAQIHTSATTRLGLNVFLKEQLNMAFAAVTSITQSADEPFQETRPSLIYLSPICSDINYLANDSTIPLPSAPPPFLTYEEDTLTKPTYLSKVGAFKTLPKEEKLASQKKTILTA